MNELHTTLKRFSALSQDTRLRSFKMLMEAEPKGVAAGVIATTLKVAPNSLSAHLNILAESGLITVERKGRNMIYRPDIAAVNAMISSLVEDCCNGHPTVCDFVANLKCAQT